VKAVSLEAPSAPSPGSVNPPCGGGV